MESEQRNLFEEFDDSYRFQPQSKEDWDKIIANGNKDLREGAYGARPAPDNTYYLGKWEYIDGPNGEKDPSSLILVRLPQDELSRAYAMAQLRPPIDFKLKELEPEEYIGRKPLFKKNK